MKGTALTCSLALLVAACGDSADSGSPASTSAETSVPSTETSVPSAFTSPLYGYSAVLQEGWSSEPATEEWSGEPGDFGSDSPASDIFDDGSGKTIWAVGATTTTTVDQMIEDATAVDAVDHDCEAVPDSDEETTIGGEPARLTAKNCPVDSETVIGTAAVIHGEVGYYFYFRQSDLVAPDPNAVDAFTEFLAGVTFPD